MLEFFAYTEIFAFGIVIPLIHHSNKIMIRKPGPCTYVGQIKARGKHDGNL